MALDVQRVSKQFVVHQQRVQALRDVSFSMEPTESIALVGGSGSGKTTLARVLMGLYTPDSGTVQWKGRAQADFSRQEWAKHLQMVFQDPFASLNPKLSVGLQLTEVLRQSPSEQTPEELLKAVGLGADALPRYPFQFSGGQRQRIAIARSLALRPQILIADEPLSALDFATQEQMVTLFQTLRQTQSLGLLLITHDFSLAQRLTERVIVLQSGQIVEEGHTDRVLKSPQHPYTQALVDAIP